VTLTKRIAFVMLFIGKSKQILFKKQRKIAFKMKKGGVNVNSIHKDDGKDSVFFQLYYF